MFLGSIQRAQLHTQQSGPMVPWTKAAVIFKDPPPPSQIHWGSNKIALVQDDVYRNPLLKRIVLLGIQLL